MKFAPPDSVRCDLRAATSQPIANAPWSGSIRGPDSNRWEPGPGRATWARCSVVQPRYEPRHRGDDTRLSLRQVREPACGCSGGANPTSRTRLRAGRTLPRARRTAAFWRSVDALAPAQKGDWFSRAAEA